MKTLLFTLAVLSASLTFAHSVNYQQLIFREWKIDGESIKGTFLCSRNDSVFIEKPNQMVAGYALKDFSSSDKVFVKTKIEHIKELNKTLVDRKSIKKGSNQPFSASSIIVLFILISLTLLTFVIKQRHKLKYVYPILGVGICSFLMSITDPVYVQSAFTPFAPEVNTHWDNNYFYVESKGIPTTHTMMVGISNHGWQQQVPIPQCYIGANAWSIPLNPVMAANPIPVDQVHFTRGAIAIAVNGVPIFNPYTNTGVDAYLDGQLDNFGGHSGKGDDYHYHTAPLHLYNQTISTKPIAYAFDGFAVYGSLEPDGVAMTALDSNHGHLYNGEYHYHGTTTAPYMIANFAGEVTEDGTHQLIPQAQASPVRTENWTPLNGALITGCVPNGTANGYNLSYSINGVSGYATNYAWNGMTYTFNYVTPTGTNTINYNGFSQCTVPLSISDNFVVENINIYPNPFSDKIIIENKGIDETYTLVNGLGKVIYSGNKIEEQNFSNLAEGIYYLQLKNKTYKLFKK